MTKKELWYILIEMFYRNKYDFNGSASKMGESAEIQFKKIAEIKGNKITEASLIEQIDHIDFHINNTKGEKYTVDVKARKKISRKDTDVVDDVIWVEFKNVQGKNGWLYGKSNYIAFEQEKDFLIVSRLALANLCEKLVDLNNFDAKIKPPLYIAYQRAGRKDLLSLIKTEDITKNLKHILWKK